MGSPTISTEAGVLCLLNLGFIGLLPRIFFRPGTLNLHWWLTAAPFLLAAGLVAAGLAGGVHPWVPPGPALTILTLASLGCSAGSVALIAYTLGTHTRPVSLWHQDADTPAALVTHGAYARVRHPFYSAFLLALTGCVLVLPHPGTWGLLVLAGIQLYRTAVREERRLRASVLGAQYRDYRTRTGRFLPK